MRMELANKTDVGRRRENNEDYFASYENQRWFFVLLSDGMGGFEGGETASLITIKTLHREFERDFLDPFLFLDNSISGANLAVQRAASHNDELGGMGATIVALLYDKLNHVVYYAHVGDSRIYLFRKNRLIQLTEDHSEVREMVARGIISEEEAKSHKRRHVITRCIGRETGIAQVCKQPLTVLDDDQFLLCSDGLTDMLDDEDLAKILTCPDSPQEKVDRLIAIANEKGGKDNITVQLLHFAGTTIHSGFAFRKIIVILAAALVLICVASVLYRAPWSAKIPRAPVKRELQIPAGLTAGSDMAQHSLDSASSRLKGFREPAAVSTPDKHIAQPQIPAQPQAEHEEGISSGPSKKTAAKRCQSRSDTAEQKGEEQWLAPIDDTTAHLQTKQDSGKMNAETGGVQEGQTPPFTPVASPDSTAAAKTGQPEQGAQLRQSMNKRDNTESLEPSTTSGPLPSTTSEKGSGQDPAKKEARPVPQDANRNDDRLL